MHKGGSASGDSTNEKRGFYFYFSVSAEENFIEEETKPMEHLKPEEEWHSNNQEQDTAYAERRSIVFVRPE